MNMNGIELWSHAIMKRRKLIDRYNRCFRDGFMLKRITLAMWVAVVFMILRIGFLGFPTLFDEISVITIGSVIMYLLNSYFIVIFILLLIPEAIKKLHLFIQIWKVGLDIDRHRPVRKWNL